MRELRVEDALLYLDQVKMEFGDRPHIYNEFLDIMKTFKTQQIDTPGVIRRVSQLFLGNKKLVLGFNTFLPEGYKIELPLDGDGAPIAVYRAPGQAGVTRILGPGAPPFDAPPPSRKPPPAAAAGRPPFAQPDGGPYPSAADRMMELMQLDSQPKGPPQPQQKPPPGAPPRRVMQQQQQQQPGSLFKQQQPAPPQPPQPQQPPPQQPGGAQQAPPPQQQGAAGQPPVEFDHAINYVTTIKRRFASDPDTYKKFLEILHTYQKEQRGIKEVLDEVSVLFSEHPDLLKEFTYFLPDAVQAQAKAQLDQVAKEAEARNRAKASKQAIMQQAHGMQKEAAQYRRGSPSVATEQQQGTPTGGGGGQAQQYSPSPAPIPFGAEHGRPEDSEREICRSAIYGTVTFAPNRPPKRNEMTPSQAAVKKGRPQMIPELPTQTTTAEAAFFERAKLHLNRKELAPDKPAGSRRHTPYTEFLKCLHLFGSGILNKEEMVLMLRGLFMQGHAPKSGANAGGGASNPNVANDAQELLREFEEILVGRGHFADQENLLKDKSKYGDKQVRDFDFSGCDKPTPSYRSLPSDYPVNLFHSHSGQSGTDAAVLNNSVVCVPARRTHQMVWSPEEYDGPAERNNVYEENLFKVEDERFEVDMAIERNVMAMRLVEPIADEVSQLRETEEKDGQPIGRMRYKLRSRQLNCGQVNAIARLYGDSGDEVLQHLIRNPIAVLPIVYRRLRQKDVEWRKAKAEISKRWKVSDAENYVGSLDTMCWENKEDLQNLFDEKKIVKELKNARSFAKDAGPIGTAPATIDFFPQFRIGSATEEAKIFQPYMRVPISTSMPHKDAHKLIATQMIAEKSLSEQAGVARIWAEFVAPLFGFPSHWILNELRDFGATQKAPTIVKYGVGQRIVTAYGEGEILAVIEGSQNSNLKYRVQLPFGVGFIRPASVLHLVPGSGAFTRQNGRMEAADLSMEASEHVLGPEFTLLFANQSGYTFLRVYSLLVNILDDVKRRLHKDASAMEVDTVPPEQPPLKEDEQSKVELKDDYPSVVSALQKVLSNNMTSLDFERLSRFACKERVAQLAVLPMLVAKCADIMCKASRDGTILPLFDYAMMDERDPIKVRSHALTISENANYRIQYDRKDGFLYFSFMEPGQELFVVPEVPEEDELEEDEEEEPEAAGTATEEEQDSPVGEKSEDDVEEDGDEAGETTGTDIEGPDAKRQKLDK